MPAKKTTKTAKAAKTVKKVDYAAMSEAELVKARDEKTADLLGAKQSHRSGELVNPRVLGTTRRDIARINTALKAISNRKESK